MPRRMRAPIRIFVTERTLNLLQQGQKTVLIHVDDRIFTRFEFGDTLVFEHTVKNRTRTVRKILKDMRRYKTLEEALEKENLESLGHGTREEALEFLQMIYGTLTKDEVFVSFDLEPTPQRIERRKRQKSQP